MFMYELHKNGKLLIFVQIQNFMVNLPKSYLDHDEFTRFPCILTTAGNHIGKHEFMVNPDKS